ncbi:GroES-like protein [Biscogniauxia mediterranea]|nr:GroES-like protein [Biscogniauxia mediterranea]
MSIQQYQTQKGGPFTLVQAPKPTPGAGEVCIRPRAVALNAIDWKNLMFGATVQSWPAVLGTDGAGVVEAVGKDVTAFKVGDEVMSYAHGIEGNGAFQDVYTVSQLELTKKPTGTTFEEAASLPTIFLTAAAAILIGLGVTIPGLSNSDSGNKLESILILGGSSGVGSSAIELLRLALPNVTIITTSSATHHAHLKSLGANVCLERAAQNDAAALKAATPGGAGVDAILDAVGAGTDSPAVFDALKADGPKIYSLVITRPDAKVPEGLKSTLVAGPMVFGKAPGAMAFLHKLVEEGRFKLPLKVEVVGKGFEAIDQGLKRFPADVSGTKLVVTL